VALKTVQVGPVYKAGIKKKKEREKARERTNNPLEKSPNFLVVQLLYGHRQGEKREKEEREEGKEGGTKRIPAGTHSC